MCNFKVQIHVRMERIRIEDISHIRDAASEFLERTAGTRIFAFYGSMGAGKTTFISALCSVLGVKDEVASPTFTIVNEYMAADGTPVYHFDFYRIGKTEEVLDIGYEEYVSGEGLLFMEWPEKIEDILPEETLRVKIEEDSEGCRTISF